MTDHEVKPGDHFLLSYQPSEIRIATTSIRLPLSEEPIRNDLAMTNHEVKPGDPFLLSYHPSELRIASEFLTTWLPFLTRDLCHSCTQLLSDRIRSIDPDLVSNAEAARPVDNINSTPNGEEPHEINDNQDNNFDTNSLGIWKDDAESNSLGSLKEGANESSEPLPEPEASTSELASESLFVESPGPRMSWADMAQEDEEEECESSRRIVNVKLGKLTVSKVEKPKLSRDQSKYIRFSDVVRKNDFICLERIKGKIVNIVEGLELHEGIFSAAEQRRIVDRVYELQEKGKKGELRERTYTAPRKWMRGKGRVTIQFGCCYNYATDKNGNPPGILQSEIVDPIPQSFKVIIRRLVSWHVIPPTCVPDSCIVNIYEEGDCIPPHIDNHDFVRPFCTVSFLSECNILFGTNIEVKGPGEFDGPQLIPLPVGSVLVFNGKGADVAKHCVPAVPSKRISITFRRMDDLKRPVEFVEEPDLQGIQPLSYEMGKINRSNSPRFEPEVRRQSSRRFGNVKARRPIERIETRSEPRDSGRNHDRSADWRRVRPNPDG